MNQPTDRRFEVIFVTLKMTPSPISDGDFKLMPPDDFRKLCDANEKAEQGRMFMHKAMAVVHTEAGEAQQGVFQSELYDTEQSDGKKELRELGDAVVQTLIERFYPSEVEA